MKVPNELRDILSGSYCFEVILIQAQMTIIKRLDHVIMCDLCGSQKDVFVATTREGNRGEGEGGGR